jgi:hypothetical protein
MKEDIVFSLGKTKKGMTFRKKGLYVAFAGGLFLSCVLKKRKEIVGKIWVAKSLPEATIPATMSRNSFVFLLRTQW